MLFLQKVLRQKSDVIINWPTPKTVTYVCSFLASKTITDVSLKTMPNQLSPHTLVISGDNPSKKKKSIAWNEEYEQSSNKLKQPCSSIPILAYIDFTKPFKFHMDPSELGLGAILYQTQEGVDRVC